MSNQLDEMAIDIVGEAVDELLRQGEEHPRDWTVFANEEANTRVASYKAMTEKPSDDFIAIIETYLSDEGTHLSDYGMLDLLAEHHDEERGFAGTLARAAATCLQHRVLDDLETLGLKDES